MRQCIPKIIHMHQRAILSSFSPCNRSYIIRRVWCSRHLIIALTGAIRLTPRSALLHSKGKIEKKKTLACADQEFLHFGRFFSVEKKDSSSFQADLPCAHTFPTKIISHFGWFSFQQSHFVYWFLCKVISIWNNIPAAAAADAVTVTVVVACAACIRTLHKTEIERFNESERISVERNTWKCCTICASACTTCVERRYTILFSTE